MNIERDGVEDSNLGRIYKQKPTYFLKCFSFYKLFKLLLSASGVSLIQPPPPSSSFSYKHLFNESSELDELCQKIVDLSVKTCHPYFFNQENINQLINQCQRRQKIFNHDINCDLAKLHLMQKTLRVESLLGSPDGTVRVNTYTVHIVYRLSSGILVVRLIFCPPPFQNHIFSPNSQLKTGICYKFSFPLSPFPFPLSPSLLPFSLPVWPSSPSSCPIFLPSSFSLPSYPFPFPLTPFPCPLTSFPSPLTPFPFRLPLFPSLFPFFLPFFSFPSPFFHSLFTSFFFFSSFFPQA